MSGPRQVARIAHKARRLVTRDGYGQQGASRKKRRDVDPRWYSTACRKWAYRTPATAQAILELQAIDDPHPERLNVYPCGGHWHVGHRG